MLNFCLSKEFHLNSGYLAFYKVVLLNALTKYQEDTPDLVSHRSGDGNSFCSMLYSCEEFSLLSEAKERCNRAFSHEYKAAAHLGWGKHAGNSYRMLLKNTDKFCL